MTRRWLPFLMVVTLTTGCSALSGLAHAETVPSTGGCPHPDAVVLVVGAHHDVAAPSLDPAQDPHVTCLVRAAIEQRRPVMVVTAASHPELVRVRLAAGTGSLAQQDSPWAEQNLEQVEAAVREARPASAGIDDLAALSSAADAARAVGAPHAWLVLLDSGLDDRGPLDFTVRGMLAADPPDVVDQLRSTLNLPQLRGFTVVMAGLGYTSPPQAALPAKWRTSLTAIWTAVTQAAGARTVVIPVPVQGPPVRTDEPVTPVPVPADPAVTPATGRTYVLDGGSAARFLPNSTAFADPAAAARTLRRFAAWLAPDRARHAWLVGTTADVGPLAGQVRLSLLRAERVRDEILTLGAVHAQVSVTGVGSHFPQFTPDRSASGALLAGLATRNRAVRITLRAPTRQP